MQTIHPRPSVLIVDDDEEFLELISLYLADEGFDVLQAADGIDALSCLYGHRPPRLVLVDLKMPRMDGLELIAQIRSERALTEIPIVALSGDLALLRRAREVGASETLTKPLRMDVVLRTLVRLTVDRIALPVTVPD